MDREQLKREIKEMIVAECDKKMDPAKIEDDKPLIGNESHLGLDSLDALQIAVAVQRRYGKRVQGSTEGRQVLQTVNTLADFILS
jgi:acyl carrier protein